MAIIVPTITTDSSEVFQANLTKFGSFTKRIQLDVSDGSFAPSVTVPIPTIASMEKPEGVALDLHLMSAIFSQLVEAGIKPGIALIKTTFPGRVKSLIELCEHAMIFAGTLGSQGGTIDMMQTEKIPLLQAIKPGIELGWDGGANLSNVRALSHAGINVINVGSAITSAGDPSAMYQSLIVESEKKGVLV